LFSLELIQATSFFLFQFKLEVILVNKRKYPFNID